MIPCKVCGRKIGDYQIYLTSYGGRFGSWRRLHPVLLICNFCGYDDLLPTLDEDPTNKVMLYYSDNLVYFVTKGEIWAEKWRTFRQTVESRIRGIEVLKA